MPPGSETKNFQFNKKEISPSPRSRDNRARACSITNVAGRELGSGEFLLFCSSVGTWQQPQPHTGCQETQRGDRHISAPLLPTSCSATLRWAHSASEKCLGLCLLLLLPTATATRWLSWPGEQLRARRCRVCFGEGMICLDTSSLPAHTGIGNPTPPAGRAHRFPPAAG